MKLQRLFSLFLALMVVSSCLGLPVSATEAETTTDTTAASTSPSDTTGETAETSEPTTPPVTGPQEITGYVASDVDFGNYSAKGYSGPEDYTADAKAALLIELSTDSIAYAMNPDERVYPASLTKVMTCLLALEYGNLEDEVTATETALDLDVSGSGMKLQVGETLKLEDLLNGLMVASANDAAMVIAEHIGGSIDAFVELMNQKAQELGCQNTHFANPHGLHDENHYTTARDMAIIFKAALKYDKFQEIYQTTRCVIEATNLSEARTLVTTNYLTGTIITSQYYDKRVIGGKTGFTTPAGRCVICTAEDDDITYLCVIMGAESYDAEGSVYYGSFVEASQLLDYGFNSFMVENILSPLSPVAQLAVAEALESVVVTPKSNVTTILPKGFDTETIEIRYDLDSDTGLTAPLEAGQVVGTVGAYIDGVCVASTDLVTMTAVERHAVQAQINETASSLASSPWAIVMIVSGVLLAVLLILVVRAQIIRSMRKKRREKRRKVSQ